MSATELQKIIEAPLPNIHNSDLRKEPRKTWAKEIRALLKELDIVGVGVTTPVYSQASTIHIDIPQALANPNGEMHQALHDALWKEGKPGYDCPYCRLRKTAKERLEAIILSAFPDLDDRSERQSDYFDYCLSFNY